MDYQNFRGRFEKSENPKDKRFLKYCFVCTEEAKPGKEHLKNYGGIVCLSCRAFWRRSHQTTKNPALHCKKGNNCTVTAESRRHCKKCRYNRCLLAGMRPEAVLDTEQKKVHFRKYYSKQEKDPRPKRRPPSTSLTDPKSSNPETMNFWDAKPHCVEPDPEGFAPAADPGNFSNFSSCFYENNYDTFSHYPLYENSIQMPNYLDNIQNESLFYWNPMDYVNCYD